MTDAIDRSLMFCPTQIGLESTGSVNSVECGVTVPNTPVSATTATIATASDDHVESVGHCNNDGDGAVPEQISNECWRPADARHGELFDLSHMHRPGFTFVNQELMAEDLEHSDKVDKLLFNVALAISLFTCKIKRFSHLMHNIQSVKFQLFHKILASLFTVVTSFTSRCNSTCLD